MLRKAVEDLLPEQVLHRKKSPYPKTFDPRYARLIEARMALLMQEDSPLWQIIRPEALREQLNRENPWPWYGQLMRGPQTAAYFLQMDIWLRKRQIRIRF